MHDPRTSPALRTLAELTGDPPPRRWTWTVRRLDGAGRLTLGTAATTTLGVRRVGIRWHGLALYVTPHPTATGLAVNLDDRGRLLVPAWLRGRGRDVVVGLESAAPALLVAPVEVLDRFGDVLAGGGR